MTLKNKQELDHARRAEGGWGMRVNQNGEEVFEDYIFTGNDFSNPEEIGEALLILADHLGFQVVRTNATKHGNTVLELRLSD